MSLEVFYDEQSINSLGACPVERPGIPYPELRSEFITVPGRHGSLYVPDTYENINVSIQYNILEETNIKPLIREIRGFLNHKKKLKFSDDSIFYKIKKIEINETENEIEEYGVFTVDHICDPFQYADDKQKTQVVSGAAINNPGTIESEPLYYVSGSGSGTLTINGEKITFNNLSGTFVLDAELKNAYDPDTLENRNWNIRGIIPPLKVGDNLIEISGGITSVEVQGRWRYL